MSFARTKFLTIFLCSLCLFSLVQAEPTQITTSYFGGDGEDELIAVTIGPDGSIYVAGHSMSRQWILPNRVQEHSLGEDEPGAGERMAFIARLSPDGKTLFAFTRFPRGSVHIERIRANTRGVYVVGFAMKPMLLLRLGRTAVISMEIN